jgi:Flp pilus assembly protein TadG
MELGVALLLLLVFLAGVVDFGNVFRQYIVITNACREGARYASHFPHYADGIRQATKDEAALAGVLLADTDILIDPEPPVGAYPSDDTVAQPGETIKVSVEFDVPTMVAGIVNLPSVTIRSRMEMVVFGLDKM